MKEYLVFRLYGPMASWGQAAVGGDRPTGLLPSRSAVIGLLAAALGIKRDEEEALQQLQGGIQLAVKQCTPSSLMRDYHTTQVPSHKKGVGHYSRKSELNEKGLNTVLSSRDYRCDGLWIVAISLVDTTPLLLSRLRDALLKPTFMLYLGRKSCPLSVPVLPRIVTVDKIKEALDIEFPSLTRSAKEDRLWFGANQMVTYFWEGEAKAFGDKAVLTTQPWDEPVDRSRWQFRQRIQHQWTSIED